MSREMEETSPRPLNKSLMYDVLLLTLDEEGEGYDPLFGVGVGDPGLILLMLLMLLMLLLLLVIEGLEGD